MKATIKAAQVMRLVASLGHVRSLADYLPRPQVAFTVPGGAFCICGAGVPLGSMHCHGGVHAIMVTNKPGWA